MTHSSDLVRIASQEVQPLGVVPRCGLRCRHSLPGHLGERAGHVLNKAAVNYRRAAAQPVGAAVGGAGKPPVQKTQSGGRHHRRGRGDVRTGTASVASAKGAPPPTTKTTDVQPSSPAAKRTKVSQQLVGLTMLVLVAV